MTLLDMETKENVFQPDDLGMEIFKRSYAYDENETWEIASLRVADHVSAAENGDKQKWFGRFAREIVTNRFMPGGRIWYGSGRPKAQLLNCVSGETLIHTVDGLIEAKELVGKEVPVLSEGGIYRLAKWAYYGQQELYEVTLSNGDVLEATAEHEWIVSKEKGGKERVYTTELQGRNIPFQHRLVFLYDEESWLEGVRRGLTFGDGSLYMHGAYSVVMQFGDSRHLIEDYFDNHSVYNRGNLAVTKLPSEWKTDLPEGDESLIRGFIAGYIAADGCVDSRGHIMLHSSNLDNLIEVRKMAASVGLPSSSIKLVRQINPWTGDPAPLWKLTFVKAGFYQNNEPDLKLILKNKHREYIKNSPIAKKQGTMRVESVRSKAEVENVYCCVEPETHTMVIGPGYLTGQCFVIPTGDSREAWGETLKQSLIISGTGGGVGINFSPIRPNGSPVKGTGGHATGPVSLMRMDNGVGQELVAGGNRRMAKMSCLDINHPDILEFLDCKLVDGQLNNTNISVVLNFDPVEFQQLVRDDGEIELEWGGRKTGETVNARELWKRIVQNAWINGEPGVLNGYEANEKNNIYYHKKLISTNPCGEIWLEAYGCCDLGALVLPRFVDNYGNVDWEQLENTIRVGVRFLDDVLTVNQYPLNEIKENCEEVRRIGLGVLGLHSMFMKLGLKYSSPEAMEFTDQLFSFIKHSAYDSSIMLAVEKGPFPAYDEEFVDSGFMQKMKPAIRRKVREYGIRNCALLTVAPTGTTAMVCGTTSGIEPIMAPVYWRRMVKDVDKKNQNIAEEVLVIEPAYDEFGDLVEGAMDVPVEDHFQMQKVVQNHVDNAVSKTINLPTDYPLDNLSDLWLQYLPTLKGTTFYRFGSRENEPFNPVPHDEIEEVISSTSDENIRRKERVEQDNCATGVCLI
jgi:adenosylcobalamin-dependent ribonucleoside-diphosphate reductase